MKPRAIASTAALGLALFLVAAAAGCGGDGDTTSTITTGAQGQGGGAGQPEVAKLEIKMGEYFFAPKDPTVSAPKGGSLTIDAPNDGSVEHELVLFKSNADPAKLPRASDGGVDEEKLDKQAEEIGEIADVEAGDTKAGTFKLAPGRYVMFCNVPGHYAQGMYGTLTVTK